MSYELGDEHRLRRAGGVPHGQQDGIEEKRGKLGEKRIREEKGKPGVHGSESPRMKVKRIKAEITAIEKGSHSKKGLSEKVRDKLSNLHKELANLEPDVNIELPHGNFPIKKKGVKRGKEPDEGGAVEEELVQGKTKIKRMGNFERPVSDFENLTQSFNGANTNQLHVLEIIQRMQQNDENFADQINLPIDENGSTALHLACEYNLITVIDSLIRMDGVELDKSNDAGETPPMIAAKKKNLAVIDAFIKADKIQNSGIQNGNILHYLVLPPPGDENELVMTINKLLDAFPELMNQQDADGKTPLMLACQGGSAKCVELFLERLKKETEAAGGVRERVVEGDMSDDEDKSEIESQILFEALHLAFDSGDPDTIEVVLKHRPPIDDEIRQKRDKNGNLLLHYACKIFDQKLIAMCLKGGLEKSEFSENNKRELTEFLLESNNKGETPLSQLVKYINKEPEIILGYFQNALKIIDESKLEKLDQETKDLLLLVACTCREDGYEKIGDLIKYGANINKPFEFDESTKFFRVFDDFTTITPLMLLMSNTENPEDTFKLLTDNGLMNVITSWSADRPSVLDYLMKDHVSLPLTITLCLKYNVPLNETVENLQKLSHRWRNDVIHKLDEHYETDPVTNKIINMLKNNPELLDRVVDERAKFTLSVLELSLNADEKNLQLLVELYGKAELPDRLLLHGVIAKILQNNPELLKSRDENGNTIVMSLILNNSNLGNARRLPITRYDFSNELPQLVRLSDLTATNNQGLSIFDILVQNYDRNTYSNSLIDHLIYDNNLLDDTVPKTASLENLIFFVQRYRYKDQVTIRNLVSILERNPKLLNEEDSNGLFPLDHAFKNGDTDCIKYLLDYGADPLLENSKGDNVWSKIVGNFDGRNMDMKLSQYITLIINSPKGKEKDVINAPLNRPDIEGMTLTMLLAESNNIDWVTIYQEEEGADIYLQDKYGDSTISRLLKTNDPRLVNKLRALKLDVTKALPDHEGNTLLHLAVKMGNFEVAKYLIKEGMSITDKNIYDETLIDQLYNISIDIKYQRGCIDFICYLLEKYHIKGIDELITQAITNTEIYEDFEKCILSLIDTHVVPNLLRQGGPNPLEIALLFDNAHITRAIVNGLGKEQFEHWLNELPKHITIDKKSLKFDLDESHLAHEVAIVPEKPFEDEYQMNALTRIFKELTCDPQKEELTFDPQKVEKFRKYLSTDDKTRPPGELLESLEEFIENCNDRKRITNLEDKDKEAFWGRIEKAVTNAVKEISELEADPKVILEKKAKLLGEYLRLMGYCATRLDLEFEKLYYLNSGVVRSFQDEIYFLLSSKRGRTTEGLAPQDPQSIHFIKGMLNNLEKYNIPIHLGNDLLPEELELINPEISFKKKYKEGIWEELKNHLSDKITQEQFAEWLEENGRTAKKPDLAAEDTNRFFEYAKSEELPPEATKLERDLFAVCESCFYFDRDLNDPKVRKEIIDTYFTQGSWMNTDFALIKEKGNDAFNELDPELREAIEACQMKGKLHIFQNDPRAIENERKRLMAKYKEIKQIDESTNSFFDNVMDFVKNHGTLPPENEIPDNQRDLFALITPTTDLSNEEVRKKLYLLNEQGQMNENFKKITKDGDSAFNNLDPSLQQAIDELGVKGKLSLFQYTPEYQRNMKQKLLDKHKEIKFQNVTEENIDFLLQKLGVLKVADDAPEWMR